MFDAIHQKLLAAQDEKYRQFHQSLCPNADQMIGVRMPVVRQLAREVAKNSDFRSYLDDPTPHCYEETMIEGIIIATAPLDKDERLQYLHNFIPKIDNWAVCDCVAASFKFKSATKTTHSSKPNTNLALPEMWAFLLEFQNSSTAFALRFMLVMFLDHFLLPEYLPKILNIVDQISSEEYYVMMAQAWLIAEAFIKERAATLSFLQHNHLSKFVQNKAIQKIRESYRVPDNDKTILLSLKRN